MRRNQMREQGFFIVFENLFSCNNDMDEQIELYSENVEPVCDYAKVIFSAVNNNKAEYNEIINKYSKSWKLNRLPKVTVAILYVALFEILNNENVPNNVAINEAVELAKKYGTNDDASYINGILGSVVREA